MPVVLILFYLHIFWGGGNSRDADVFGVWVGICVWMKGVVKYRRYRRQVMVFLNTVLYCLITRMQHIKHIGLGFGVG